MKSLISMLTEDTNELSKFLKDIEKNKDFIKFLNDYDYEYTISEPPTKDELIDGLCDYVAYYAYTQFGDKYKYINLSDGTFAHYCIYDPTDKKYKDGVDFNGKAKWKDLTWYKNSNSPWKGNIEETEEIPEIE